MNSQHPAKELWVKNRIKTAIEMAEAVWKSARVGADDPLLTCAIEGIVNGASLEIIRVLGMQPGLSNLRDPNAVVTMVQIGSNSPMPWVGNAGDILEEKLEARIRLAKLTTYLKTKCKLKLTTDQISAIKGILDTSQPV